jgi:hypothetical protein
MAKIRQKAKAIRPKWRSVRATQKWIIEKAPTPRSGVSVSSGEVGTIRAEARCGKG